MMVSFIGGGNRSTWRKQPTCRKSLTNYHIIVFDMKHHCNNSMKIQEDFEDTKGAIKICILKKNRMAKRNSTKEHKQRSTKHTHKTKDQITRTPLKIGSELRCSGRVSSSYSTSGTRRVNLVTNPVICHVQMN